MDSYDELKSHFIKQNLYRTNHLENWRNSQIFDSTYPKIITTTRTEIFGGNDGYESWFMSNDDAKLEKYKEIRLVSFNADQRNEYLEQYAKISIKKLLHDIYLLLVGQKAN
jgi:hypothetical protein